MKPNQPTNPPPRVQLDELPDITPQVLLGVLSFRVATARREMMLAPVDSTQYVDLAIECMLLDGIHRVLTGIYGEEKKQGLGEQTFGGSRA